MTTHINPLHPALKCSGKDTLHGFMASVEMAKEMVAMHRVQLIFNGDLRTSGEMIQRMLNRFEGSYPSGLSRYDTQQILENLLSYGMIYRQPPTSQQILRDFIELVEQTAELIADDENHTEAPEGWEVVTI